MDDTANIQCNKLMKLENFMLMYGVYNAETLERLINTVHDIHNTTLPMKDCSQANIALLYSRLFMHIH